MPAHLHASDYPEIADSACILVVASQSVGTPALLDLVRRRAEEAPTRFILLIPDARSPTMAKWTLRHALRMFRRAAGGEVEGIVAEEDPVTAARNVMAREHVDEIVISLLAAKLSRWARNDVPAQMEQLGVPVTVVSGVASPA
jgi:hypothetical protein